MPAKCPYCETNTHGDSDKEQYPVCERNFLTKLEAWAIIAEDKPHDSTVHVFVNPKANLLFGTDLPRHEIKEIIEKCKYIELCDPKGEARRMKHGLNVVDENGKGWFMETDEKFLRCYEALFIEGLDKWVNGVEHIN